MEHSSVQHDEDGLARRMSRRRFLYTAAYTTAAVAGATLLAACGSDDAEDEDEGDATAPVSGAGATTESGAAASPSPAGVQPTNAPNVIIAPETLTIVSGSDIVQMIPNGPPLISSISTLGAAYEYLVNFKRPPAYPELEGRLAESWELVAPDRWRFHLRQGVKFHNGSDFDAESVVYSLDAVKASPSAAGMQPLMAVEPVDKFTVDLVTDGPWFILLYRLNSNMPMEDPIWSTGPEFSLDKGVGTGPYKLVEWIKGDRVIMERNDDWWGGQLPYKRLVWRGIPEASTRVSSLLAGEVDLIRQVAPQDVERVNSNSDLEVRTTPSNRCANFRVRQDGIYADKGFRQALNYAVDKDAIVEVAMGGFGVKLAGQYSGPNTLGYHPDLEAYPYDPERARELIQAAGYDDEPVIVETSRGTTFQDMEISQAVGGFLEQVGLNVEVRVLESGEYTAKKGGDGVAEGIFFSSSGNIVPDFENTLDDLCVRGTTELYWQHPRALEIRELLQGTVDEAERIALAREGAELLRQEVPVIFMAQQVDAYGVKKEVAWEPRPDEHIWAWELGYQGQ